MSDQGKPEHPAPWRWHETRGINKLGASYVSRTLADRTGEPVDLWRPFFAELIRLAPEMAELLRRHGGSAGMCSECQAGSGAGGPHHHPGCRLAAILAALDAARKTP